MMMVIWLLLFPMIVHAQKAGSNTGTTSPGIELDLPPYYPEFYKHPQHIFSGRTVSISLDNKEQAAVSAISTGGNRKLILPVQKGEENAAAVEIPFETQTGSYDIVISEGGKTLQIPVDVEGITQNEVTAIASAMADTSGIPSGDPHVGFRTKICSNCIWEYVFEGDPVNPKNLYAAEVQSIQRSSDSGRTWKNDLVDDIITNNLQNDKSNGDPKFYMLGDGMFYLAGLFNRPSRSFVIGGILYKGGNEGMLDKYIFKDIPVSLPEGVWLVADYPKIAADKKTSTIYITANAFYIDNRHYQAILASKDGGKTFEVKHKYQDAAPISITVGSDGTVYAAKPDGIIRFDSFSPVKIKDLKMPKDQLYLGLKFLRLSTTSNRAWIAHTGPEIIADTNPSSKFYGRLYLTWSAPEKNVDDKNFEYYSYGYNFDVFVSYSNDRGETWSKPVHVNDDRGKADQFSPSLRIDSNGNLHAAFFDHRNFPDEPAFDVYYSYSPDGGNTFSENVRVNDVPFENPVGGRSLGDYFDLVAGYPDLAYVAYPCPKGAGMPSDVCMAEICKNSNSCAEKPAAAYTVQLKKGWNLISTPVLDSKNTPFLSIKTTCKFTSDLLTYNHGNVKADSIVNSKSGFWISVDSDCSIDVPGDSIYTIDTYLGRGIQLESGWNFVGGAPTKLEFGKILGDCDILKGPYKYNDAQNKWEISVFMEPGLGYAVASQSACKLQRLEEEAPPPLPNEADFGLPK